MRIEAVFPYLSLAAAGAAAWAAWTKPGHTYERALKAVALGALAGFAYLRGVAPATLSIALLLSAAGQYLPPRKPAGWATNTSILLFGCWVAFAVLFWRHAGDTTELVSDPAKFALALTALVAGGAVLWSLRKDLGQAWVAAATDMGALVLMTAAAAMLDFNLWPALAGAAAVFAAEAMRLWRDSRPPERPGGPAAAGLWALNFLGQAAMAYVFLR